ncbi:MAG TPA: AMP-binding protein [Thermoleophilia bacterium]|nr:AMP-binding protein [Thermoleophilia bacterium]
MELTEIYEELRHSTVWQRFTKTADRLPDKVAVVDGDIRLTYRQVREEASRLAQGLSSLGLTKGSVAAVYLPNSAELVTLFYALQKLGVVIAWVNPNYREHELRFILENSGAQALFLFQKWQGYECLSVAVSLEGLPELRTIVAARPSEGFASNDERVTTYAELLAAGDAAGTGKPGLSDETVSPDDLSMLIYTSGTTARPKGAMIRQSQTVRAGYSYSLGVNATEDDVFIGILPMSHSYGCGALLVQPFILGATLVTLDLFSAERAFALIEKERVTLQLGAPAHYIMELDSPARGRYDLSSVRAGLIAGQIAPAGLITRVEREMSIHIASFLGSSEVGPGLSIILPYPSPLELRERSIGYPLVGTEAKIVDPVTGEELAAGESGELVLRGWHVTQGYWNNPEETANQIRDGWLHTGDLAARDEEGCFSILGRIKDCINRGGFKVIPSEIEAVLVQHPHVAEACVVGTPNPVLGESICACVILDASAEGLTLAGIRNHVKGRMADFKLPDEMIVLTELPRMPGGVKVNRYGAGGVVELAKESTDKQTLRR